MRLVIFLSGAAIFLIGIAGVAGIIPMSVLNTVSFSQPNVSCGSTGACSVTFTVTNNNATSNFAVYMKVQNSQFQTVWQNTIQVQQSVSSFTVPSISLGSLRPSAYIFSAFAVNNYGTVIGGMTSTAFNVSGNYYLYVDPVPSFAGSVSPSCPQTTPCKYNPSQKANLTFAPQSNYYVGSWCYFGDQGNQGCLSLTNGGITTTTQANGIVTGSGNSFSIVMNQNYEISVSTNNQNIQYFTVTPAVSITGGCAYGDTVCKRGTVNPASAANIYAQSGFGPTSATFTATANANYTFANWQINSKNFSANPLTLQYSDLQAIQISGQVQFTAYAFFKAKLFYPLGIGAYAGITTTPAAKNTNYVYPAGASVTVTVANVASNVCFTGWLVDGNPAGSANSVTVTMDKMHNVFAQGVGKPSTGCTGGGGGNGSFVPYIFLAVGGLVMALGVRRKR